MSLRILWVPHTTFQPGVKARADYFIERLAAEHTLHVLCWDVPIRRTVQGIKSTLQRWTRADRGVVYHHFPRLSLSVRPGHRPLVTQALFRRMVRRLVADHDIDVVVAACNWYALGFPPPDLPVPLVMDYFDLLQEKHEKWYFEHADAVFTSSSVLHDRARKYSIPSYYVPNGVETALFRHANGEAVRAQYGLDRARVVSLIGLTTSDRLYFLDAVEIAARQVPNIHCLIVGDGELASVIKAKVSGREHLFRFVGAVPYERIPAFFACTDVGLYPGDLQPYFHAALPIKVLEYTAAMKPVVAPPLEELMRLGFANIVFAEPTAEAFATAICRALQVAPPPPDLAEFEMSRITDNVSAILQEVVDGSRNRSGLSKVG